MSDERQQDLLTWQPPNPPEFFGATYDEARDGHRLNKQLKAVHDVFASARGKKFSLRQLADATDYPEASISARFRDLVRLGFPMDKEHIQKGLWLYWMKEPDRPPA